jgi:hypothetical protein
MMAPPMCVRGNGLCRMEPVAVFEDLHATLCLQARTPWGAELKRSAGDSLTALHIASAR